MFERVTSRSSCFALHRLTPSQRMQGTMPDRATASPPHDSKLGRAVGGRTRPLMAQPVLSYTSDGVQLAVLIACPMTH